MRPDGTDLAYQVVGPRDAPPLLLLSGQANSHHWWDGVRKDLAAQFRTISFDYRGTGATASDETGAQPWTTQLFADDAVAVLDALQCERTHVYGTSMGGRVAQMFAATYPERVARLVLACTSPGGTIAHERTREVRRALGQPSAADRRAVLLDLMYTPAWLAAPPRKSTLLGDPNMGAKATRMHLRASDGHDAFAILPHITAETLVLHGNDDLMVPTANAQIIADAIPGAVVEIHEGRHGFFDEFPSITDRVADFLFSSVQH
ncbi:alpha/beta fold hydrolase [Antrihabitans sp. YC2-6]|nr:alpha/beta fold hydrolase [Antrihabitans sp. YC2-6]